MPDPRAVLARARKTARNLRGVAMTLRRGEQSTTIAKVLKASGRAQRNDADEVAMDLDELDLIIDPADYKVGGVAVEPEDGDLFEEVVGAISRTYLAIPAFGEGAWRWSDEFFTDYRIHVLIRAETPA